MSLQATQLFIQASPLPATFVGSPNDMLAEMIKRMKIVSPSGTNFIYTGDIEPSSNVGPWLRNGTQWWVFDEATKRYVPLDISASLTIPYFIGNSLPTGTNPQVWLKTTKDATDQSPTDFGDPMGWFFWNGFAWIPILFHIGNSLPVSTDPPLWLKTTKDWTPSSPTYGDPVAFLMFNGATWVAVGSVLVGSTANRPLSPFDYQTYYDTDISCLIWWERSMWRTVSGVKGDVKAVVASTSTEALEQNPGWTLLADPSGTNNWAGRSPMPACKEPDSTVVLTPDANVTSAVRGAIFPAVGDAALYDMSVGTYDQVARVALWHLYKL